LWRLDSGYRKYGGVFGSEEYLTILDQSMEDKLSGLEDMIYMISDENWKSLTFL
jgi:hypothetical protein